jgi:hypothetical protein
VTVHPAPRPGGGARRRGAIGGTRAAGDLSDRESSAILLRARRDRAHWELVEVSALVLDRGEDLLPTTGLRILDALHLASAVLVQAASTARVPLATADAPLGRAASAAGWT